MMQASCAGGQVLAVELVSEQLSSQVWTHIRYLIVWMEKCLGTERYEKQN